jgi:periplasmic divalent cation tolerance protein
LRQTGETLLPKDDRSHDVHQSQRTRSDVPLQDIYAGCVNDFVQVSTAADRRDAAAELARSAVEAKLAASAQVVGPVISVFWHEGELGTGEEWQILFKTTVERYPDLEAHLIAKHPWQNPEISAVPLTAGSASYLDWIRRTVASA